MKYAATTTVTSARSRAEIEETLERYGADQFGYYIEPDAATVLFRMNGRHYRLLVPLPPMSDFLLTPQTAKPRHEATVKSEWEQAIRQRWRALVLLLKAKLEAVELGITSTEDEFLANTLMPDGMTVGDWARPQIDQLYLDGGTMPPLLLPRGRDDH